MKLSLLLLLALIASPVSARPTAVTILPGNIIAADGKAVFPIGFTLAPPPDSKTPDGRPGYAELATLGFVFHRCGPPGEMWNDAEQARLDHILDKSAEHGIYAAISIPAIQSDRKPAGKDPARLRAVIEHYRNHPGLAFWKGLDEPEWGKTPPEALLSFYQAVRELDPNHPVWVTQAPRGTIKSLSAYDPVYDIAAIDIYPIGYPPGKHSHLPNKNISVIGDYARWLQQITHGKKPFWMVLQIAWSGVVQPGKTLRFPTYHEERFMVYQSIANGARGLLFFGGNVEPALNVRDRRLGWNWTFYERILKPILLELAPSSPLYPALIAPDNPLQIKLKGARDIDFCYREADGYSYLIACKREGSTVQASFEGLPEDIARAEVLFESPRSITVAGGRLTDWFGPNEVHVYRMKRDQ